MSDKMPCSITDGEQFEEYEARQEVDEDEAYERFRQEQIDENARLLNIEISKLTIEINRTGEAKLLRNILRIIQGKDHDDSH